MKLTGEKQSTRRKTCLSATLSTTNPTWTDPGYSTNIAGVTEWTRKKGLNKRAGLTLNVQTIDVSSTLNKDNVRWLTCNNAFCIRQLTGTSDANNWHMAGQCPKTMSTFLPCNLMHPNMAQIHQTRLVQKNYPLNWLRGLYSALQTHFIF
jgi:hypothetical protein